MAKRTCTFPGCSEPFLAFEYCDLHYRRFKRYGDPAGPPPPPDLPGEYWLPVLGYEGLYEVSNLARVRGLDRWITNRPSSRRPRQFKRGRILAQHLDVHGYLIVSLACDGVSESRQVHRIVADAFLGLLPPGQQTRHGPKGKLDNTPSNLRYGTPDENKQDMLRDGTQLMGTGLRWAKLTEDIVRECRERYAAGGISYQALADEFGVSKQAMMAAITGKKWKHVA